MDITSGGQYHMGANQKGLICATWKGQEEL